MRQTARSVKRMLQGAAALREAPVAVLWAALFVVFVLRAPYFLENQGLVDYARQYTPHALLAVGLTLIIGSGGIDISVGSVLGFCAVTLGVMLSRAGAGLWAACLLAVLAGTAFGAFNGLAVARLRLQPVVVTLSTMAAARGLTYVLAGQGISSVELPHKARWLEQAAYVSPAPVVLAVLAAIAASVALSRTTFGRALLAIGGNETAARLSGINVARVTLAVYTLAGALCGLAGIMTAGMMNTATTDAGTGYEFEAITAVLVGGTSISGGEATVVGSMFGVLMAATLGRGFDLMGISDLWKMMCLGAILIASVLLDQARRHIARQRAIGEQKL